MLREAPFRCLDIAASGKNEDSPALKRTLLIASARLLAVTLMMVQPTAQAQVASADYPLPHGHFVTKAGGGRVGSFGVI